jgi:hypothetical protein
MLKEMMFQFIETPNTIRHSVYYLDGRAHYNYLNKVQKVQMQITVKAPMNTPFEGMEFLVDKSIVEIECIDFIKVNPNMVDINQTRKRRKKQWQE